VPTPFHHLSLARELLNHPGLPKEIRRSLVNSHCAFLFGSTAPDVQVVSGQPRQQTHFFSLPLQEDAQPAWIQFLLAFPGLAEPRQLPAIQAAFLAGYLCHLQADWLWVKDIFAPVFGPTCAWGTFRERLYLHNVLRAYLDVRLLPPLWSGMDDCLRQVVPRGWLPFVEDRYLLQWRDFLSPQLQPGATTQTVEVFSSRQGISALEFHDLLESEKRMQEEVFIHLTLEQVEQYNQRVLEENSRLLSDYLASTLHQNSILIDGSVIQGVQL
jgi:hypothetical protein